MEFINSYFFVLALFIFSFARNSGRIQRVACFPMETVWKIFSLFSRMKNLREFYYWDTISWVYQILGLKCSRFNGPTCAPMWTEIRRQYSVSFCRTTGIRQYSATLRLLRSWTKFAPRLVDLRSRAVSFESRPYFCGRFHEVTIVQA